MNVRLITALVAGKFASLLSRFRGHKGSSLPGLVALRVYSGSLRVLAGQVRKGIIVVSGTNGKTTTSNMITGVINSAGYKTISNRDGANLISGVTTCFVMNAGIGGRIDCDYAVLEVDEASTPGVLREVTPAVVVLTNFFRDQLDRYWELDKITGIIRDSLKRHGDTTLVLNADDPLVAQFSKTTGLKSFFYGLGTHERTTKINQQTREAKFCPFCGFALTYDFFHYGQLGTYHCPGCDFKRPVPRVEALETRLTGEILECRLLYNNREEAVLTIKVQGLYNLYNALAAFSVGLFLGIDPGVILDSLQKYQPVVGRMEAFMINGKKAYLNLVKNPTGFNEGLTALLAARGTKDVFIAINDNGADGRDISWLWDVDFERLGNEHSELLRFVCSGTRGEEMAVRLKYAGVPLEKITVMKDMQGALDAALSGRADYSYLFSTYTALWPVHKIINRMADKEGPDDQRMPSVS